jgi:beta-exotoxin I transport system permease protein
MRTEIARLDVTIRRRSLIGYAVGLALYVLVVVALYPAFEHSSSLDKFVTDDATAAALFGVTGPLSTSGGWLNGNIYANFFPLIMLLLTIGYGAASLAGQDEEGTLCLVATLPVRRTTIVLEKAAAMVVQAAVLAIAVGVCVVVGRSFHLTTTIGNVAACSASTGLMGLDFGLAAMAVGALTGRRGTAIGVATTLAAVSYLLSSLAAVVSWLHPGRYVSLFYWAVGDDQISRGVSLADWAVLVAVDLCALYAAVVAFRRLDLH